MKRKAKKKKNRCKRTKREANTHQAPKPPNSTRVQSHTSHAKHKTTQTHTNAPNRAKTPLKREIRPYSKTTHRGQSRKTDKRREHTTR